MNDAAIEKRYQSAAEQYKEWGGDTQEALDKLGGISISLHCWQGDDVGGFERPDAALSGGGIQVTGSYPGRARTPDELRADLEKAYSLIPGDHRLNLHSIYGEFGGRYVERDRYAPEHYQSWVDWARKQGLKLDFNCTCFSHPKAESGFTLSSRDEQVRRFWIEHIRRCREISAFFGRSLGSPCLHNLWIPDGSKDIPADRKAHRAILRESLDEIFSVHHDPDEMKDSLESKLFGIGSEAYVVGSHEFYTGYALTRGKILCLDMGHFHPTESVADKISAILEFSPELVFHVSRGLRWDSDHVVILDDSLRALAEEIVRCRALERARIALDFFDAGINRVGAWVLGTRATLKAMLIALLEPHRKLREAEDAGDGFARLALMEELKSMPFGAVWDYYCLTKGVPPGDRWIAEVRRYEKAVTGKRS
jgi:L-rhamnose isomerase